MAWAICSEKIVIRLNSLGYPFEKENVIVVKNKRRASHDSVGVVWIFSGTTQHALINL